MGLLVLTKFTVVVIICFKKLAEVGKVRVVRLCTLGMEIASNKYIGKNKSI
ncbi:hypothetical protein KTC92_09995 [Clostridium sp. CM027]|uniref:hypothetical protein n=1 Tax=Clostridium sp. CM027 TaxID=2849865 RepID=UPI001C6F5565|nr:hypothetical protein [Clostridium sp. CM027]MBW9146542.1 hypothetical protein [Clostridium sp. CM027]UVE39578.1 hypothetical protein KTC92_09995 [Clostridium sp. CM027]